MKNCCRFGLMDRDTGGQTEETSHLTNRTGPDRTSGSGRTINSPGDADAPHSSSTETPAGCHGNREKVKPGGTN